MNTGDFDRIHTLGFRVTMEWRCFFSIDYLVGGENILILYCEYDEVNGATYEEFVETCCDVFYGWYGEHRDVIDGLDADSPLWEEIVLGSISRSVRRTLNLDKLL